MPGDPYPAAHLRNSLLIEGQACLDGARVSGRLRLVGGRIRRNWTDQTPNKPRADVALSCIGTEAKGGIFFSHHAGADERVDGVSLVGASTGVLVDDPDSWGDDNLNQFDGFQFSRIADESPRSARQRIAWLMTQRNRDIGEGTSLHTLAVRRQPWKQTADVIAAAGEARESRRILLALERRVTAATRWPDVWKWLYRFPYDVLCGYGYAPGRLLAWAVLFWLAGVVATSRLAVEGYIAPADQKLQDVAPFTQCRQKTLGVARYDNVWFLPVYCRAIAARNAPRLYPFLYSLDNMAPVVDFGQKKAWVPRSGKFWSNLLIVQYGFGIVATSVLLSLLGSFLVRKSG